MLMRKRGTGAGNRTGTKGTVSILGLALSDPTKEEK